MVDCKYGDGPEGGYASFATLYAHALNKHPDDEEYVSDIHAKSNQERREKAMRNGAQQHEPEKPVPEPAPVPNVPDVTAYLESALKEMTASLLNEIKNNFNLLSTQRTGTSDEKHNTDPLRVYIGTDAEITFRGERPIMGHIEEITENDIMWSTKPPGTDGKVILISCPRRDYLMIRTVVQPPKSQ